MFFVTACATTKGPPPDVPLCIHSFQDGGFICDSKFLLPHEADGVVCLEAQHFHTLLQYCKQ